MTCIALKDLPYLTATAIGPRLVPVVAYYDSATSKLQMYSVHGDKLLVVPPIDIEYGAYLARQPKADQDEALPLDTIVLQHFSFRRPMSLFGALHADALNILACVHKYFALLWFCQNRPDAMEPLMVSTELEYAFGVHRSYYDLLQRLVDAIDKECNPAHQQMPDSFAKLAQHDADKLQVKYNLPPSLTVFYASAAPDFLLYRSLRDAIYHHGKSPGFVFSRNDGFAFSKRVSDELRLTDIPIWNSGTITSNGLVPILPLFAALAQDVWETGAKLARSLQEAYAPLPTALAENHTYFLRSKLCRHRANLERYRGLGWVTPEPVLAQLQDSSNTLSNS